MSNTGVGPIVANVPIYTNKKAKDGTHGNKLIGNFPAKVTLKAGLSPGEPGVTCEIRVKVKSENPEASGKTKKETVLLEYGQDRPYLKALHQANLNMCVHSELVVTRPADLGNPSK